MLACVHVYLLAGCQRLGSTSGAQLVPLPHPMQAYVSVAERVWEKLQQADRAAAEAAAGGAGGQQQQPGQRHAPPKIVFE